jgi:L,D-transpeptidase catalytic domain
MRHRASLTSALITLALVGTLGGCGSSTPRHVSAARHLMAVPAVTSTTTVPTMPAPASTTIVPRTPEPASTTIATLSRSVHGSATPGGPAVTTVPGTWYGYRSVLPVIATSGGWLKVRKAQRPNQSTAWIPASAATLSTTPYYLVLDLTSEHLQEYLNGEPIHSYPAGIGTTTDPTVTGNYFIAMKTPPPDPSYGPFVLATSAHSDAIADWEGLGDAIIAIHGPIDTYDNQLIGTTGARISHGCIRLHNNDLARLADIPAGTPLKIIG